MTRIVAFAAFLLLLAAGTHVQANDRLSAAECVDRAIEVVVGTGATLLGEPQVEFLVEKESRVFPYVLAEAGCVGFLAVGQSNVKDLDLALHANTGVMLAQDAAQDSHPYVRYCGAAGLSLQLVVQMYEGRGEVSVIAMQNAPQELAALGQALQACGTPARDTSMLTDVGPEPPGPSLAQSFEFIAARLADAGYRSDKVLIDDTLAERRRESREIELKAGTCYAIAAIGDATVSDLDLRVLSTGAEPAVLAEDTSRERTAVIKVCPPTSTLTLDVRMYQGQGRYQIHAFVAQMSPTTSFPIGVDGPARTGFIEISHSLARRGMQLDTTVWALAQPGEQISMPISVTSGRCYAFGAVVGPELFGADLDVRLVDPEGRLLAWELGPSDQPLVFHCPDVDQVLHLIGEAHGVRAPGRFLMIVARDAVMTGDKS